MWNYETGGGFCILWIITFIAIRAIVGTCPEYQCENGGCYRLTDICDGTGDCSDGGDERDCARRKCEEGRFECANHRCISPNYICDTDDDCKDGSDERNCTTCATQVFTCQGGGCVKKNEVCDKTRDCLDGSDEANCTNNGCSWVQFACSNGQCRPSTDRCDGAIDCRDRSDEANCRSCSDRAFKCLQGGCIRLTSVCDGSSDCPDGSDEENCTNDSCETDQFQCTDGSCISRSYLCDGDHDCGNGIDEANCTLCATRGFTCRSGGCVRRNAVCDKKIDCSDGSDEADCTNNGCSSEQFACKNGQCRIPTDRCDGIRDCSDGSDETNCTVCAAGQFACRGGGCVRSSWRCDGVPECSDGSDEENCGQDGQCGVGHFTCASGKCLRNQLRCDGDDDCGDGFDELNCTVACTSETFKCQDGSCIKQSSVCNHRMDCVDGSDELNCSDKQSPLTIRETWHSHSQLLSRKHMDDHVVFYFDANVPSSITWPFQPVSNAWKYVKETYGSMGPTPLLYVVMHSQRHPGSHTATFRDRSHGYRNIIDCGQEDPVPLSIKHSFIFNILITTIGHVIRQGVNQVLNNADENVCDRQMREIASYDVYKHIKDPSEEMDGWVENKLKESKNGIYWFRDWFLPIYETYGEASVLERFYNLTYNYFRLSTDKMSYSKKLNKGEFVHFWSGAAGTDLRSLARQAINCSENCLQEVLTARKEYPYFNYTVNIHTLGFSANGLGLYFQTYRNYPSSFYEKVSNAWQYFKSKYGPFPYHLTHTIVLNNDTATTTNNACKPLQYSSKSKNDSFLYIIICDSAITPKESVFLDEIITHIGSMAMKLRSKTENWWPAFGVSKWTMASIIVYDIHKSLENTMDASRWLEKKITESSPFPRAKTRWFQYWYFQIYNDHGGSDALIRFLNLLEEKWTTEKFLNTGEFVHFWSAAAGTDLQRMAENLMGWNTTYQKELNDARKALPFNSGFNYTWKNDDENARFESTTSDKPKTTPLESSGGSTVIIIIGIFILVLVVIAVIVGLKFYGYKRKIENLSVAIRKLTADEVDEFYKGNPNLSNTEVNAPIQSQPFNKEYEIPRATLSIDEGGVLGSGEYGLVRSGRMSDGKEGSAELKVAVKTVKPNVEVAQFKALLSEIKILAHLGKHESIAALLGTVTDNIVNREVFMALEFCGKGDLLRYLRANNGNFQNLFKSNIGKDSKCVYKVEPDAQVTIEPVSSNVVPNYENPPISTLDLIKWSRQIAHGMAYLSSKNVVHGDLAARNVLLTDDNIAKISDFGLSRQLLNYSDYLKTSTTPLPWRWLAIESLTTMAFSVHSDVWSYGVTLWEIFTLGKIPYPNRTWDLQFVNELTAGQRLSAPDLGNAEIYQLMLDCTKYVPYERVSFPQIKSVLKAMEANFDSNQPSTSQNCH